MIDTDYQKTGEQNKVSLRSNWVETRMTYSNVLDSKVGARSIPNESNSGK